MTSGLIRQGEGKKLYKHDNNRKKKGEEGEGNIMTSTSSSQCIPTPHGTDCEGMTPSLVIPTETKDQWERFMFISAKTDF
jgi:hypothetical protein